MNHRLALIICFIVWDTGIARCQFESPSDPGTEYRPPVAEIREIRSFGDVTAQPPVPVDRTALAGCDMHVVGMYMPKNHSKDDRLYVDVMPTGRPMVLVLTGYFGAQWHLEIDPKADVRHIIVSGYYEHEIAEPHPNIPMTFLTYFPSGDRKNPSFVWAWACAWHSAEGRELKRKLRELTGLDVTTFQGEYAATRFVVDGEQGQIAGLETRQRGTDTPADAVGVPADLVKELARIEVGLDVALKQYGKLHPSIRNLETRRDAIQKVLAALDAAATSSDQSGSSDDQGLRTFSRRPPDKSAFGFMTLVDRRFAERQRDLYEITYRDAEKDCAVAAEQYRQEAAQDRPDKAALEALHNALLAEVTKAFEAKARWQQLRIHLAELDVQSLKEKQHRREALSREIIERRVADLVSGKDLTPTASSSSDVSEVNESSMLETWLKDIRSIGSDAVARRDAALAEVDAALKSDVEAQNLAATKALAQTGDVRYEKSRYRERLLELCRSSNRDLATSALYALYNTDRKPGDLALVQEVLSKPEAARAGHSISHLLLLFGDGTISGQSEETVLTLLNSTDRSVRREALRGLWGAKTSDKLMARVIELVDDQESHHDAIYFALATSPNKSTAVIDKLIEVLSDPDWNNWDRALWGLGYGVPESEQQKVADAMLQMYENRSDPRTREKCARLIQQYGNEDQKAKVSPTAEP